MVNRLRTTRRPAGPTTRADLRRLRRVVGRRRSATRPAVATGETKRWLARGVVTVVFTVATLWLALPLLETPTLPADVDPGAVLVAAEVRTMPAASVVNEITEPRAHIGYADSSYNVGTNVQVDLPRWTQLWTIVSGPEEDRLFCTASGPPDEVTIADVPPWVRSAATTIKGPVHISHWTLPASNEGYVATVGCDTGSDSWPWHDGGSGTSFARIPALTVLTEVAPSESNLPDLKCPNAHQSVEMPVRYGWRSSFPGGDFQVSGTDADRDVGCSFGLPSQASIEVSWPGAAVSVADQAAQAALVPRGLLAGAGLGIVAQLLVDGASGLAGLAVSSRRRRRAVVTSP